MWTRVDRVLGGGRQRRVLREVVPLVYSGIECAHLPGDDYRSTLVEHVSARAG